MGNSREGQRRRTWPQALSPDFLPGLLETHGNLANFADMIFKVTGKEAASSYGFYGCYCGFSGRGTPKDATDR